MSEQLYFYKGLESDLPIEDIKIGALYHCTDTGNTYIGTAHNTLKLYSSAVGKATVDGGEIFNNYVEDNNEATTIVNQAYSIETSAFGRNTRAGTYGYRMIDSTENTITLDDGKLTQEQRAYNMLAINDIINFDGSSRTYGQLKITKMEQDITNSNTIVTVTHKEESTPIPSLALKDKTKYSDEEFKHENWLWCTGKPLAGEPTPLSYGAMASGTNTIAAGRVAEASGYGSQAIGHYSHAEGLLTVANYAAHAEGNSSIASGGHSHAEGKGTLASNTNAHAEGENTKATGRASHAEGVYTNATGQGAHAEGQSSQATANYTHAEGFSTQATAVYAHAEGLQSVASARSAHAEGEKTNATYQSAHAEGLSSTASQLAAHAEGRETIAEGAYSHAEGYKTKASYSQAHAEGCETQAKGQASHAEGHTTIAEGNYSHAEGKNTVAGTNAHAEGLGTIAATYQHVQGKYNEADSNAAHIVGWGSSDSDRTNIHTLSTGGTGWFAGDVTTPNHKLSEKANSTEVANQITELTSNMNTALAKHYVTAGRKSGSSLGTCATAEGSDNKAQGENAHAEGNSNNAEGKNSHAEGYSSTAKGIGSHVEGFSAGTSVNGQYAHAEGFQTDANGWQAHAEGRFAQALQHVSHAEGLYTIASGTVQHVQGQYNIEDSVQDKNIHPADGLGQYGQYAHIVGNGTSAARSNAHTLDWKGNAWFAGDVYVGSTDGKNKDEGSTKLATTNEVNDAFTQKYITTGRKKDTPLGSCATAEGRNTQAGSYKGCHIAKQDDKYVYVEGNSESGLAGSYAHAEGEGTIAAGHRSHAEGYNTIACANQSHAEGYGTIASGYGSHAQGKFNIPDTDYLHVVGNGSAEEKDENGTITKNEIRSNAHTLNTKGEAWFAGDVYVGSTSGKNKDDGSEKLATENYVDDAKITLLGEQDYTGTIKGAYDEAKAVLGDVDDTAADKTVYGVHAIATAAMPKAGGTFTGNVFMDNGTTLTINAPRAGDNGKKDATTREYVDIAQTNAINTAASDATSKANNATNAAKIYTDSSWKNNRITAGQVSGSDLGTCATAEGSDNNASGKYSHAEGYQTKALGNYSHAEGYKTIANGIYANASGGAIIITDDGATIEIVSAATGVAHAEGGAVTSGGREYQTQATNAYAHAEGAGTTASGIEAHAEGALTTASGQASHAEGWRTTASGHYSHAEGYWCQANHNGSHAEGAGTKTSAAFQHVLGTYNADISNALFIIGNGSSGNGSNAHYVDKWGNGWFAGSLILGTGMGVGYGTEAQRPKTGMVKGQIYFQLI